MAKRPLIIDCDPGVDDAQCIMLLNACGEFDIRGITPVHGNVSLRSTGRNALFLNELLGIGCAVARGAENALIMRLPRAEYAHGGNGLGGYEYTLKEEKFDPLSAWDFIYEQAKLFPGELELIAVGPLTNIALAVKIHPEVVTLVKQITIMGGGATTGNSSPYAEFNVWQDPHAAEIVLKAGFKSLTLVDLDTCYTGYINLEEQDRLASLPATNKVSGFMKAIVEFRKESVKNWKMGEQQKKRFADKMIACDAVAAAICIDPSIAVIEDRFIFCECRGPLTYGQTVVDWNGSMGEPNTHLARSIDRDRYVELLFKCVDFYNGEAL